MRTVLERPPAPILDTPSPAPEPQPAPQRQGLRERFRLPRTKTAVATPMGDEETVVIANRTDEEWTLHLGYHALGTVASQAEREIRVARWQMLTARQVTAPLGAEYLIADLTPAIQCVEIRYDAHHGQLAYYLRLVEH